MKKVHARRHSEQGHYITKTLCGLDTGGMTLAKSLPGKQLEEFVMCRKCESITYNIGYYQEMVKV